MLLFKLPLIFILKNFLLVLNFIHLILRLLLGTEMCSGHKTLKDTSEIFTFKHDCRLKTVIPDVKNIY